MKNIIISAASALAILLPCAMGTVADSSNITREFEYKPSYTKQPVKQQPRVQPKQPIKHQPRVQPKQPIKHQPRVQPKQPIKHQPKQPKPIAPKPKPEAKLDLGKDHDTSKGSDSSHRNASHTGWKPSSNTTKVKPTPNTNFNSHKAASGWKPGNL